MLTQDKYLRVGKMLACVLIASTLSGCYLSLGSNRGKNSGSSGSPVMVNNTMPAAQPATVIVNTPPAVQQPAPVQQERSLQPNH